MFHRMLLGLGLFITYNEWHNVQVAKSMAVDHANLIRIPSSKSSEKGGNYELMV
jgi:hypothetical protein